GRYGEHVHGANGRKQDFAESLARGPLSGRLHQYGTGDGKYRAEIRDFARSGGCVCGEFAQESSGGNCCGFVQRRNGSGGSEEHFCADEWECTKRKTRKANDANICVYYG